MGLWSYTGSEATEQHLLQSSIHLDVTWLPVARFIRKGQEKKLATSGGPGKDARQRAQSGRRGSSGHASQIHTSVPDLLPSLNLCFVPIIYVFQGNSYSLTSLIGIVIALTLHCNCQCWCIQKYLLDIYLNKCELLLWTKTWYYQEQSKLVLELSWYTWERTFIWLNEGIL